MGCPWLQARRGRWYRVQYRSGSLVIVALHFYIVPGILNIIIIIIFNTGAQLLKARLYHLENEVLMLVLRKRNNE